MDEKQEYINSQYERRFDKLENRIDKIENKMDSFELIQKERLADQLEAIRSCESRLETISSLYSETIDVAKIAEEYGGGGHKGAAGFSTKHLIVHKTNNNKFNVLYRIKDLFRKLKYSIRVNTK